MKRNSKNDGWIVSSTVTTIDMNGTARDERHKSYPKDSYPSGEPNPLTELELSDLEIELGLFQSSTRQWGVNSVGVCFAYSGYDFDNYLSEMNQSYGDEGIDHVDRTYVILGSHTHGSEGSKSEEIKKYTFFLEESRQSPGESRTYVYETPIANDTTKNYWFNYIATVNEVTYDTQDFQANKLSLQP